MKELKATVKIFDEKSDINEVRKHVGRSVIPIMGDNLNLEGAIIEELNSISVYENSVGFCIDDDEYDKFAIIEIDNQ